MNATSRALVAAIAALLIGAVCASAQVPEKINYQTMLTDDMDEPLADQSVSLFFTIYDDPTAGTLLWSELHDTETTNSIGVVSVMLGTTSPLTPEVFATPTWMEVSVNGQTLSPRRELVSAPYALSAGDAATLAGVDAADYTLDDDLSNTGVINTPGNPVDWTMLKNVPAGFADGTDDTGGTGDGHSLDADDGDPVDAVYVDADGDVGIGTTAPANKLVVGPDGSGLSYAQFANPTTGYNQVDGLRVGVASSGGAFIAQNENSSITFLTNAQTKHRIEADGTFKFGTGAVEGVAEFYPEGGGSRQIELRSEAPTGGHIGLFEDDGDQYLWLEPDYGGTGGFLEVASGDGSLAFEVDGNADVSGDPMVTIGGTYGAVFETWQSGDASVALPVNAISDAEILDEAGAAGTSTIASLALAGPTEDIAQQDILVMATGLVLALGTIEAEVNHAGVSGGASFAVSATSATMPGGGGTMATHFG